MPKVDIAKVPVKSGTFYPAQFQAECLGRHKQALGDAVGLTQFGVNITRIEAGQASALQMCIRDRPRRACVNRAGMGIGLVCHHYFRPGGRSIGAKDDPLFTFPSGGG